MNKLWGGVVALACAGAAFGQESTESLPVVFNTPFAFHVADKLMPAGEYQIRWLGDRRVLLLNSEAHGAIVYAFNGLAAARGVGAKANASIVFTKYNGGTYFLSQVWHGDGEDGFQTLQSKKEREIVTSTFTAQVKPATIMILAQRR